MSGAKLNNSEITLLAELEALLTGFWLTDLSNFSSFFFQQTKDINWIGFYLTDGKSLKLGPFAGKPACVEIAFSRGVCGAAFTQKKAQVVSDVHDFPGHISCDPASRSELVIPFYIGNSLIGVLDIDSPSVGRFSDSDLDFFCEAIKILATKNKNFNGLTNLKDIN